MNSVKRIILALGSNMGDRERNFADALNALSSQLEIDKVSAVYSTASLLRDEQADYCNICCSASTFLSAEELLAFIKETEKQLGRQQTARWQSRLIDIDIIDYSGEVYESEGLVIPHREMAARSFVLYPLRDVDENYVHPVSGRGINELIAALQDDLDIRRTGDLTWR